MHRAREAPQPDPYSDASPGYRTRTRETVTQIALSMTRVDLGEPLKRLAAEPQSLPVCSEAQPFEEPQKAPPVPASPPVSLSALEAITRNWRNDYGLLKRS